MSETFAAYRMRVLGYLGDRDPLRVQRAMPARLERLLGGLPRRALGRRPAPGKWSVVEILAHLADAELAMGWRLRNMLATPGVRLQWWDEHLWSEKCHYARSSPRRSLATFRALRESNLALLRSVPRGAWESCHGLHDTRGRQTVAEFVRMEAAHDLNHLRQIEQLLRLPSPARPAPSASSRQPARRRRS
jgi:DinB superfamily